MTVDRCAEQHERMHRLYGRTHGCVKNETACRPRYGCYRASVQAITAAVAAARACSWILAILTAASPTVFGQDTRTRLPTPQIIEVAHVGGGLFGPRYRIAFAAHNPDIRDCGHSVWFVMDEDGNYSYTTNSLGEREVDPGEDELRRPYPGLRTIRSGTYTMSTGSEGGATARTGRAGVRIHVV